ncbi:diguanylate cyclase [Metabacillus litoralis]|uniref:sensor domain-containing diguanylate cyclase n=1 Tax=Metabacillus litoralis TaxID=152268 RepID=UPI001CFF1E30|nr:diguanylate cyclase [Metabacillus litoralis]
MNAKNGVLDLREIDFDEQKYIEMNGEWGIYWDKLIGPGTMTDSPTTFVSFPHTWMGSELNKVSLSGEGYATYKLKIKVNEDSLTTQKALYIPLISTASKLWINGKLVSQIGEIGSNSKNEQPAYNPHVITLDLDKPEIDLVLQVSNYSERKGGIWGEFLFGNAEELVSMAEKRMLKEMFIIGGLIIFGFYHFVIYILRRTERAALYFGILCLLIALRSLVVGEVILTELLPDFSWEWHRKIEYWTISIAFPVFILFLNTMFLNYLKKPVLRIFYFISLLYSLFVLFTPAKVFSYTINFYQLTMILTMGYVIYELSKAWKKNVPGIKILLISSLIFTFTALNDVLYYNEWINTGDFTSAGLYIFIFAQSIVLAIKYTSTFEKVETMSVSLKELNNTLEEKVQIRTSQLERSQVELKQLNQKLKILSNNDTLTNVPNRRALNENYDEVWEKNKKLLNSITVFMIDIDCFKLFNDTYGHQKGDEVLKLVAQALKNRVEMVEGFFARYGGEEFFVLLNGKTVEEVVDLAKELNGVIHKLKIQHHTSTVTDSVTISIGIAHSTSTYFIEKDQLIQKADEALYQSKEMGRNSITLFYQNKVIQQ